MYLFTGSRGSGKTLSVVSKVYECHKRGMKVYSNIKLKFPHEKLTPAMLSQIMSQKFLTNCCILLDELHTITDSRRSMKGLNIEWSYFFTQSRKRNVEVFATTQREMQVDVRYRNNCDFIVNCQKRDLSPRKFVIVETWFNLDSERERKYLNSEPEKTYSLYDTNEIVYYSGWF